MSSRPIFSVHSVITDGNMAASITSQVTVISNLSQISYDISWSGSTPVGTCTVEVSNTYSQNGDGSVRNAGNWTALPLSGAVTGNTGTGFIDIDAIAAQAIRLVYTRVSGTGTMQASVKGKVS